jgi:hypothetical protein
MFNPILSNQEGHYVSLHLNQTTIREPRSILCSGLIRFILEVLLPILRLFVTAARLYALISYCNTPKTSIDQFGRVAGKYLSLTNWWLNG